MKILGIEFREMSQSDRDGFAGAASDAMIGFVEGDNDAIYLYEPTGSLDEDNRWPTIVKMFYDADGHDQEEMWVLQPQ